jgi:hypothetical protein
MLPIIQVEVDGKLVKQGLQNLSARIPKVGRLQLYKTARRILARVQYPSVSSRKRAGLKPYKRTHTLQQAKAHALQRTENGYLIKIDPKNPKGRSYGVFVLGDALGQRQAWMHVNRWPVLRVITDEELARLPAEVIELLRSPSGAQEAPAL